MAGKSSPAAGRRDIRMTAKRLRTSSAVEGGGHVDKADPTNWEPATNVGTNGSFWANVATRNSREFLRREQINAEITHLVEAEFHSANGVTADMQLEFGKPPVTLNIAEPPRNVNQGNHTLQFACIQIIEGSKT